MLKKISIRMVLIQWIFLAIVMGGSMLLYSIFLPSYYNHLKKNQILEAYSDIKELDLTNLVEEDYTMFTGYEKENLNFTIADAKMNAIYTSRSDEVSTIYKNIEMRIDVFDKNPTVIERNSKLVESARILGIITQNNKDYYVCIKDRAANFFFSMDLTIKFLGYMFMLTVLTGSLIMIFLSRRLAKPIEHVAAVADKIARRDFEEKAEEDGEYHEVNNLAKSINSMSSQLQQYIGQMEEGKKQLLNQNIRQERMEKARKDFIAKMSHELKTPLTVISSQAEMLEYIDSKEDRQYYLDSIQEEINTMAEMVSGLLDATIMEHRMENIIEKVFDLRKTIKYLVMKYDSLFIKKKIKVEIDYDSDCYICGDSEYIEQAVNNFIMNAFEHAEIGGRIAITLQSCNGNIRLGVFNEGKQIPSDEMEKIWNEFYMKNAQANNLEANLAHAGLGLYIVKSIITMHGGKFGVENLADGVEFWFTLPCAELL